MLLGMIEKIVFGALLIFAFQFPVFAVQYEQFLNGFFAATKFQVDGYEQNAARHEFENARAMIKKHLQNPDPSVRDDAQQKLATLDIYAQLKDVLANFSQWNIIHKAFYIFFQGEREPLDKTMQSFQPGIPLSIKDVAFCSLVALLLTAVLFEPLKRWGSRAKRA